MKRPPLSLLFLLIFLHLSPVHEISSLTAVSMACGTDDLNEHHASSVATSALTALSVRLSRFFHTFPKIYVV